MRRWRARRCPVASDRLRRCRRFPEPPELREVPPIVHLSLSTLQAYGRSHRPLAHYLDIGELSFDYAGMRIDTNSPGLLQTFQDGRVVQIKRDARAEKRAHDALARAGFVTLSDVTYDYPDEYGDAYALRDSTAWPQFVAHRVRGCVPTAGRSSSTPASGSVRSKPASGRRRSRRAAATGSICRWAWRSTASTATCCPFF